MQRQYPEDAPLEISEDDDPEEIADKLGMMDDEEFQDFGMWIDELYMAYQEEVRLRYSGREGH